MSPKIKNKIKRKTYKKKKKKLSRKEEKGKKTKSKISKLIYKGGQGCIFERIPCGNESINNNKQILSKISFQKKSAFNEFKINQLIRKIPSHKSWSILWTKQCETPNYSHLKEISEIDKCINLANEKRKHRGKSLVPITDRFEMLVGPFGGVLAGDIFESILTKDIYKNKVKFVKSIQQLFGYMGSLFYGVSELQKHKICHHDINERNIVFANNKFLFIDFGISLLFSDKKRLDKRLKTTFLSEKIYECYPYDYILYYGSVTDKYKKYLEQEFKDTHDDIYRKNHKDLEEIHQCMSLPNLNAHVLGLMKDIIDGSYQPTPTQLIKNLDIYSLGILLPSAIHKYGLLNDISLETIVSLCHHIDLKDHFQLFRDMSSIHSEDRLTAQEALKRYKKI